MGLEDESRAAQPAPTPATPQGTPPGQTQPYVCAMCLRAAPTTAAMSTVAAAVTVINGASLCAAHARQAPHSALPYAFGEGLTT